VTASATRAQAATVAGTRHRRVGAPRAARPRGATLVELLVALALLAAGAGLVARALPALARAQEEATLAWQDLAEQLDARNGLARDLRFIPLPAADADADAVARLPALAGDARRVGGLHAAGAGLAKGWFTWQVEQGALERLYWLDAAAALAGREPDARARLLTGVSGIAVRYLDDAGRWHGHWPTGEGAVGLQAPVQVTAPASAGTVATPGTAPSADAGGSAPAADGGAPPLPRAIEVEARRVDGGTTRWLLRPGLP